MISIIVPTWNEATCIAGTIASLRRLGDAEIIVVDGGSADDTLNEARGADRVLTSPLGRAVQMNAGAAAARGDVFLFLHADCTLEPGSIAAVERRLGSRGVIAGCFSMRVEAAGLSFRCIDTCATARVRLTGIAYGDQGLFLRADDFRRLGGFPPLRFMEDVFFSRTLRSVGRVVVDAHRIFVSPRRWRKVGIMRQTLTNWTLTGLALAGISPDRLADYYPHVRQ
jgi:rSAM/selenodomain-associated transferase 2